MPEGYYGEVAAELKEHGFALWKAAKGSHEKWRNDKTGKIVIVPRNLKSRHTANGILKDAGSQRKL